MLQKLQQSFDENKTSQLNQGEYEDDLVYSMKSTVNMEKEFPNLDKKEASNTIFH